MDEFFTVYRFGLQDRLLSLVLVFGVLWSLLAEIIKPTKQLVQQIARNTRP